MALFKQCSQPACRKALPIEDFGRNGLDCYCKPCRYAAYQKHKQKETVDIKSDLYGFVCQNTAKSPLSLMGCFKVNVKTP